MITSRICICPRGGAGFAALASLVTALLFASAASAQDCPGGGGPCDEPNGTPGCDDVDCCMAVCAKDPTCCSIEWTQDCADLAAKVCTGINDNCADAIPISLGDTPYDTTNATTDGPAHPGCQYDGQTYHDIWFDYTADFTGGLTVTTCEQLGGSAEYDTDLVVYDGCDCANLVLLGCNDDDSNNPCGSSPDYHSTVQVAIVQGNCYKIRVGGWQSGDAGLGVLHLEEGKAPPPPGADDCADAAEIFLGDTPFSTIGATTDGPPHDPECDEGGYGDPQVNQDIWYDFNPAFTGVLTVTTCNQAAYDTKLAIYDGCVCPMTDANLLACNDDGPGCAGYTSELQASVVAGNCYKIRIGGYTSATGTGTVSLISEQTACPGSGSCYENNGTPGCDDANCCTAVCNVMPSCCDVAWDQACADAAVDICGAPPQTCDLGGNVLMDQIGPDDSALGTSIYASQDFEAANDAYDVAALDDFEVPPGDDVTLTCVDFALGGWNGFVDPSSIESYGVEIYTSPQAAGGNLTGDAGSITGLQPSGITDSFGPGYLVNLDLAGGQPIVLSPGTYWVAVIPVNDFATDGQTGLVGSSIGNSNAYQANPNGGFGFPGGFQQIDPPTNLAYRVVAGGAADPCPWDLDGSGNVGILDLLMLLAEWGTDPGGPPDFDGDGTVGILDLLTLLANWGACP